MGYHLIVRELVEIFGQVFEAQYFSGEVKRRHKVGCRIAGRNQTSEVCRTFSQLIEKVAYDLLHVYRVRSLGIFLKLPV